jgi:hypothetical protein
MDRTTGEAMQQNALIIQFPNTQRRATVIMGWATGYPTCLAGALYLVEMGKQVVDLAHLRPRCHLRFS